MDQTKNRTEGYNGDLVAGLFDLLCRRTWLSVRDPSSGGRYAEFRRLAMRLAKELNHAELAEASEEQRRQIGRLALQMQGIAAELAAVRVIPAAEAAGVYKLLLGIAAKVGMEV